MTVKFIDNGTIYSPHNRFTAIIQVNLC